MRILKKILVIIVIALFIIQFVRPARNVSNEMLATDITKMANVPDKVLAIFKNSCYDCHSNNTRYPWYMNIEPVGWVMANHIREGKANLNFSEFGTYSKRKQSNKLRAIGTSINDGSMPIKDYTMMHIDAVLSKENKDMINNWVSLTKDSLLKN